MRWVVFFLAVVVAMGLGVWGVEGGGSFVWLLLSVWMFALSNRGGVINPKRIASAFGGVMGIGLIGTMVIVSVLCWGVEALWGGEGWWVELGLLSITLPEYLYFSNLPDRL